ncbi:PREDICTED: splicing regulatory glutamine/lysine-rich protein 1-like [Nipponia nippon]|uniref:splicing regulatory glutamine/lysine-rich protein 1-like n=1 Tax=Nipponia nippon TaxID=128390 RepID=UPI00051099E0|nr:PREDICTED: splicing regulatory glutamine/lysine-rich protein 1-like [Nipponia nippon]
MRAGGTNSLCSKGSLLLLERAARTEATIAVNRGTVPALCSEMSPRRLHNAPLAFSSKVCYIKFREASSVGVAQHLTNTVFIDRALIVVPCAEGKIPDEAKALSLLAPAPTMTSLMPGAGLLPIPTPTPLTTLGVSLGTLGAIPAAALDPNITGLGEIPQPPIMGNVDPSKIDEIRRTVYVGNLNSQTTTADQLLEFFKQVGEVKFVRMAGDETQPTRFAFVEFADQNSVPRALAFNGVMFGDRPLKINHSNNAIVKPPEMTPQAAAKELEEVMKRVREAQSFISAAIEPVFFFWRCSYRSRSGNRSLSRHKDRRRSRSPLKKRSRSRERQKSRSRSRSRDKKRDKEKVKEKEKAKEKEKERDRDKEKERDRDRDKERENKDRDRDRGKDKDKDREKDKDKEKEKEGDKDKRGDKEKEKDEDKEKKEQEREKERDDKKKKEKRSRTPPRSYSSSRRSRSSSRERRKRKSRSPSKSPKTSKTTKRNSSQTPSPRRNKKEKKREKDTNNERRERECSNSKKKSSKEKEGKEKSDKSTTTLKIPSTQYQNTVNVIQAVDTQFFKKPVPLRERKRQTKSL